MGMAVGRESLHETTELRRLRSPASWEDAGSHSGEPAITYKNVVTTACFQAHTKTNRLAKHTRLTLGVSQGPGMSCLFSLGLPTEVALGLKTLYGTSGPYWCFGSDRGAPAGTPAAWS
jgi:hypothetical protein